MNLIAQLRREEGSIPHAYQDHLGFWTIGVGRLIDERKGGGLSPEDVAAIRAVPNEKSNKLAEKYGVSSSMIRMIRTWRAYL